MNVRVSEPRFSPGSLVATQELDAPVQIAFEVLCEVEKWPVWFSLLKSARVVSRGDLGVGSEIMLRTTIPGDAEQLFEVDGFLAGHVISLVGAYSLRRRIEFRLERHSVSSKIVAKVDYPAYGGAIGQLLDRLTIRRRLDAALQASLIHFKGLAESDSLELPSLGSAADAGTR
jgi:hypothetical protein